MRVSTVKGGEDYRVTTDDGTRLRLCLDTDRDMVTIYTDTHNLGGYRLERFGGRLSPDSIRRFFDDTKGR